MLIFVYFDDDREFDGIQKKSLGIRTNSMELWPDLNKTVKHDFAENQKKTRKLLEITSISGGRLSLMNPHDILVLPAECPINCAVSRAAHRSQLPHTTRSRKAIYCNQFIHQSGPLAQKDAVVDSKYPAWVLVQARCELDWSYWKVCEWDERVMHATVMWLIDWLLCNSSACSMFLPMPSSISTPSSYQSYSHQAVNQWTLRRLSTQCTTTHSQEWYQWCEHFGVESSSLVWRAGLCLNYE
jgi:hypothetical protein